MAKGDKILATEISTNSSSWYQRLRAIQAKTPTTAHGTTKITQTSDPTIKTGTAITATQINNFINALNGLQSNVFLAYANWSSYKPSTVSQGGTATAATTQIKINNMLTSLEGICANYKTYGQYGNTCTDYTKDTTNSNCADDGKDSDDAYNPVCQTNGNHGLCATNSNYSDEDYCIYGPYFDDPDCPQSDCSTNHDACPFYSDKSKDTVNNTYANKSDDTDESDYWTCPNNTNKGVDTINNNDGTYGACGNNGDNSVDGYDSVNGACGDNGQYGVDGENGTGSCGENGYDSVNGACGDNGVCGDEWNFSDDWDGYSCPVNSVNGNCGPYNSVDGNNNTWANEGDYGDETNCVNKAVYGVDSKDSADNTWANEGDYGDNTNKGNNNTYSNDGVNGDNGVDGYNGTCSYQSNYSTDDQACSVYANDSVLSNNTVEATNQKYAEHFYETVDTTNGDCGNKSNCNQDSVDGVNTDKDNYANNLTNSVYANYTDDEQNSKACSTYATYNVA